MPTQVEIAAHLDMSERNVRDVLNRLHIDWNQATLEDIRIAYIRDLRDKAAGRGAGNSVELTRAKTEEALVKAANGRLDYMAKIGKLVPADVAGKALNEWAVFANREFQMAVDRIIGDMESHSEQSVDQEKVTGIVRATAERVAGYAQKLGSDFEAGRNPLGASEDGRDS
ncbi:hypothetical protein C4K68_07730 [Pokkaliibacter plantistimulans]|uniref:Uncharacterized protein n=1 Tax=Proteobacteria bacterium 228 TaxID=2083153 RepID=A0A2S5KSU4_9PROT|nr:hypothetical protein [Pokkaliibacter plantistimulans]PPC77927.1 hypothetical protein C4K68_07730 [Pokkaliibacter plantistimulans]